VQVIDFLFDLVDALRNDEYSLTDYEASILIPCLVEKVFMAPQIPVPCWFQSETHVDKKILFSCLLMEMECIAL